MPNYTITRKTESTDLYGCTTFETSQFEDENAALGGGAGVVDGDIIWYIDANTGFTVSVDDFHIPNTTPTGVAQIPGSYKTFEGGNIPPPILGVVMQQITVTRIKVTVYLHPDSTHDITGSIFTMPSSDLDAAIPIEGCAVAQGNPIQIQIHNVGTGRPAKSVVVNSTHANVTKQELSDEEDVITGVINKDEEDVNIVTYTVSVNDGDRFSSEPKLSPTTLDYKTTSSITRDSDGNIISKTFNISKKI